MRRLVDGIMKLLLVLTWSNAQGPYMCHNEDVILHSYDAAVGPHIILFRTALKPHSPAALN